MQDLKQICNNAECKIQISTIKYYIVIGKELWSEETSVVSERDSTVGWYLLALWGGLI